MRFCGIGRGLGGLEIGRGLVEFLRGYDPGFIQVANTVVGLLGQFPTGLGLAPHVVDGVDLLLAYPGFGLGVLGAGRRAHGFGLDQLGVHFGGAEHEQQVAFGDFLPLLDFQRVDASGQFGGDFIAGGFHLALEQDGHGLDGIPTDERYRDDDHDHPDA